MLPIGGNSGLDGTALIGWGEWISTGDGEVVVHGNVVGVKVSKPVRQVLPASVPGSGSWLPHDLPVDRSELRPLVVSPSGVERIVIGPDISLEVGEQCSLTEPYLLREEGVGGVGTLVVGRKTSGL